MEDPSAHSSRNNPTILNSLRIRDSRFDWHWIFLEGFVQCILKILQLFIEISTAATF